MAINVTVSPQGGGAAQVLAWFSDSGWVSPAYLNYYRVVATPSAGYRLKEVKITRHYLATGGTYEDETVTRVVQSGNVYPPGSPDDHSNADIDLSDWELYAGSILVGKSTVTDVEVVFEQTYVPTHLLVNSATVGNPVQLVYDPTTNLLVADF